MSSLEDLLIGSLLSDRYRILGTIGRGAMGVVYRAVDERLERSVAVKVVSVPNVSAAARDQRRNRFHREARAAARLHHPNVASVYDYGTDASSGLDFLVMELLVGEDLASRLTERPRLDFNEAMDILRQAARGLAAGHRAGLVHRDVKPANLFLSQARYDTPERVCLLDFGIALPIDSISRRQEAHISRVPSRSRRSTVTLMPTAGSRKPGGLTPRFSIGLSIIRDLGRYYSIWVAETRPLPHIAVSRSCFRTGWMAGATSVSRRT